MRQGARQGARQPVTQGVRQGVRQGARQGARQGVRQGQDKEQDRGETSETSHLVKLSLPDIFTWNRIIPRIYRYTNFLKIILEDLSPFRGATDTIVLDFSSDSPLVQHLLTSWQPARHPNLFIPHLS